MKLKSYLLLCIFLFALVCIGHLLRVLMKLDLTVGSNAVPMWVSVIAVVITAALTGLGYGFYRTSK